MELGDDYIPSVDKKVISRKLLKLPLTALCELTIKWYKTYGYRQSDYEGVVALTKHWQKKKVRRQTIVSKILLRYWPQGLNLIQLAQVDCYLLIYKPDSYHWLSQTVYNSKNEKVMLSIDPKAFISSIRDDLGKLYMTHLYFCKPPGLPMVICRIQLFDFNNKFLSLMGNSNHKTDDNSFPEITPSFTAATSKVLITRSPFYVCFPLNSPVIIHSVGTDLYAKLILDSVQRCLFHRQNLHLVPNELVPIRNIRTLEILRGVSRNAHSLGPWKSYADANIELSPFSDPQEHELVSGRAVVDGNVKMGKKSIMEKSMVRFKGGSYRHHVGKTNEGKTCIDGRTYYAGGMIPPANISKPHLVSRYNSLIPTPNVEFTSRDDIENIGTVTITVKLQGNDVFGGLHELCDNGLIDVDKVPGWLAGENGLDSGLIENGHFTKAFTKGRLI